MSSPESRIFPVYPSVNELQITARLRRRIVGLFRSLPSFDQTISALTYLLCALTLGYVLTSCGADSSTETWPADQYVAGIPVSGNVLPDEAYALSRLSTGILALHFSLDDLPVVIFIRSPSQHIPEICKDGDCTDIWSEVPDVIGVQERVPGEGLSGLRRGEHVFISRIGDRAGMLDELLAHEMAHALCGCGDGPEVNSLEQKLGGEMS